MIPEGARGSSKHTKHPKKFLYSSTFSLWELWDLYSKWYTVHPRSEGYEHFGIHPQPTSSKNCRVWSVRQLSRNPQMSRNQTRWFEKETETNPDMQIWILQQKSQVNPKLGVFLRRSPAVAVNPCPCMTGWEPSTTRTAKPKKAPTALKGSFWVDDLKP